MKPSTRTVYGHTKRNLLAHFGGDTRLDAITPGAADGFRIFLKTVEGLSENTIRRRIGISKQFFRAAMRKKLIAGNPFDGLASTVRENKTRMYFVSREETEAVLDALPSSDMRLAVALARYAGLRCPSEVQRLKWHDVNWDKDRFTVHASKTEHHDDGGVRVVPIFPELRPHLQEAFERAEPGAVYCLKRYKPGIAGPYYRKVLRQAIYHAGLKPWPKLFQNLRASRETELVERFTVQVVCDWIGNSPAVAAKHYLQVTEEHYAKASAGEGRTVQKAVQSTAANGRKNSRRCEGPCEAPTANPAANGTLRTSAGRDDSKHNSLNNNRLGRTGLEPVTSRV